MSSRNTGDISGVLLEQPVVKELRDDMRSARILIENTSPGFNGGKPRVVVVELTAWGEVAEAAARIPAGATVLCSFRLGSRQSKPTGDGKVYHNLTASVSSIVALMPTTKPMARESAPPASPQHRDIDAGDGSGSGMGDVPF